MRVLSMPCRFSGMLWRVSLWVMLFVGVKLTWCSWLGSPAIIAVLARASASAVAV